MRFLGASNDFAIAVTPTSVPPGQVNAGTDNNAATNGVFGLGLGVVAATDLGLMSDPVAQVSDLGLMSAPVTVTIDLGLMSA